jgi:FkbM family methyltransferase
MNEKQISIYNKMTQFTHLKDYPLNCSIFIYADNLFGKHLLQLLKNKRPDVQVLGFVSSFEKNKVSGLPCIVPEQLHEQKFDYVVITLFHYLDDIQDVIASFDQDKVRLNLVSNLAYHGPFLSNPTAGKEQQIKFVHDALQTEQDRKLWQVLISAMQTDSVVEVVDWFLQHNKTELHYLEHFSLREGDIVLEGGVFDGHTSCRFAEQVGDSGHVYGFDPLGKKYATTAFKKYQSIVHRIDVLPCAIADKEGEIFFNLDGAATKMANEGTLVRVVSMDDFVEEQQLSSVDFIKMDVEGAEPLALKGVWKSIETYRPALAISIYHGVDQYLDIPFQLISDLKDYVFNLGCYSVEGLETVIYCTPKERLL